MRPRRSLLIDRDGITDQTCRQKVRRNSASGHVDESRIGACTVWGVARADLARKRQALFRVCRAEEMPYERNEDFLTENLSKNFKR